MKINLQALKFTPKQELRDFVQEKVSKLSRFDDKIISADVSLILEESKTPENKVCEIRLIVPGNDDFVKKTAGSFEEAILVAVDTLQTILNRKKEKASL
ncbi:MAG: ribosome-associated translation inhibitor RaiA [Bacteroidetes bacterium]|nr:ribosome-associated translation inhibitor RaiA [Bacteroidota bacterium]